jgi:hypothetical protein
MIRPGRSIFILILGIIGSSGAPFAEEDVATAAREVPIGTSPSVATPALEGDIVFEDPLFELGPASDPPASAPHIASRRAADSINFEALAPSTIDGAEEQPEVVPDPRRLPLVLEEGQTRVLRLDQFRRLRETSYLWSGHVLDSPGSRVSVVVTDDQIWADIAVDREQYEIRFFEGSHFLQKIDGSALPEEREPRNAGFLSRYRSLVGPRLIAEARADEPEAACDEAATSQVDVIALWTAEAAAEFASGNLAVDVENSFTVAAKTATDDSIVTVDFQLVHSQQVSPPYEDPGDGDMALRHLQNPYHPALGSIHELRNQHHADLAVLIVRAGDWGYCGVVSQIYNLVNVPSDLPAFMVVTQNCVNGPTHSIIHEMGHSLGNAHDFTNNYGEGHLCDSYGFRNTTSGYSSIMAYRNVGGVQTQRELRFSNPDVPFVGQAMGNSCGGCPETPPPRFGDCATADAARSMNRTKCAVSGWRDASAPAPTVQLTGPDEKFLGRVRLTWSATNAELCYLKGPWQSDRDDQDPVNDQDPNNYRATSGSEKSRWLWSDATFKIYCSGPGGGATATHRVEVGL